jgi:hypothetical protein
MVDVCAKVGNGDLIWSAGDPCSGTPAYQARGFCIVKRVDKPSWTAPPVAILLLRGILL